MGKFDKIREHRELEKSLKKFDLAIKKQDEKLLTSVETYFKTVQAFRALDTLKEDKDKLVFKTVGMVFSSALSFIPVAGPLVSAVVNGIIAAAADGGKRSLSKSLLGGAIAGGAVLGASANTAYGGKSYDPTNNSASASTLDANANAIGGIAGGQAVLGAVKMVVDYKSGTTEEVPIEFNQTMEIVKGYQEIIINGMSWIDTALLNNSNTDERGKLLFLVFFSLVHSLEVGGRGNLLLNSGVAMDEKMERYISIANLKRALPDLIAQGYEWGPTRGTRLLETLNFCVDDSYMRWFSPNSNSSPETSSAITSLLLGKVKTIAYASDYKESLGKIDGQQMLAFLVKNTSYTTFMRKGLQSGRISNFYKTAHNDRSLDEHRQDLVMGMYAFHNTLMGHLGTYNLSFLPPFGTNENNDIRVAKALIDAIATQWWVTANAYKGKGRLSVPDDAYKANMISATQILDFPYIKPYFDIDQIRKAKVKVLFMPPADIEKLSDSVIVNDKITTAITELNTRATEMKTIVATIDDSFLIKLMANRDSHISSCSGFKNNVESVINELYLGVGDPIMFTSTMTTEINVLYNVSAAAVGYRSKLETIYTKMQSGNNQLETSAEIKTKYEKINATNYNLIKQGESKDRLIELLRDIHMGAFLSGEQHEDFDQSDFNRDILKALKHITILLTSNNKSIEKNESFISANSGAIENLTTKRGARLLKRTSPP